MKDTKVETNINDVIVLIEQVNNICKDLIKENVVLKFEINHSMSDEKTIGVSEAIQRVNYLETNEKI